MKGSERMKCDYFAVLRHGHGVNNEAEENFKAGDPRAYDDAIGVPSSCHDLTDEGKRQAILTGLWLREHGFKFDEYVVSGFIRAMRTAALLSIPRATWRVDDRLGEKDSGILNTLTPSKVRLHVAARGHVRHEQDPYRFRPEDGEAFLDLDGRIRPAFDELEKRSLVVCHGHVIRVLDRVIMEGMSGWEYSLFHPVSGDIPNGAFIEYRRDGEGWVRRMSVPHLGKAPRDDAWETIVAIRRSNDELTDIIERVLSHARSFNTEAAE